MKYKTWWNVVGVEVSWDDSEEDLLIFFGSSSPEGTEFFLNFIHGSIKDQDLMVTGFWILGESKNVNCSFQILQFIKMLL
jgi:hypothetical protein